VTSRHAGRVTATEGGLYGLKHGNIRNFTNIKYIIIY